MKTFKDYLNEKTEQEELVSKILKKYKKYIQSTGEKYVSGGTAFIFNMDFKADNKYFVLSKGEVLSGEMKWLSGPSSDSVNYDGNYRTEKEVMNAVEEWIDRNKKTIESFSKIEKIYGKMTKNLTMGSEYGNIQLVPSGNKFKFTDKEADKLAKKLGLDYDKEESNGSVEKYHFGDNNNLDGWSSINIYNSEFSVMVWKSPHGQLRNIYSDKISSWDKPTKTFVKVCKIIDQL